MARQFLWGLAALLFIPAPSGAAVCERAQPAQQRGGAPAEPQKADKGPQSGHQSRKWWIDPQLRADLGITDQQSAAVDQVWQKSVPKLMEGHERLEKLEDVLSRMILENLADETTVLAQIEKVENTRAELNKGRTAMLYRMNKLLTAEQRAKVKAMYEHRDGGRRGSAGSSRR
jgi:Spy/CpxP family protein refolding chaperone